MAAQVSVYARSQGSSYASPKDSQSCREPIPPVRYVFRAFLDEPFTTGTQEGETSLKDVDFDGSPLTRRAAWGRCLKANFDFARSRLSYIYNQMFFTYEGAWEAHEGLRVIGSTFYEGKKRSHAILGEALGTVPFLGEEVLVGPDGEDLDLYHSLFYHDQTARFTDDYVQIVGKGLAKSKLDADGEIVRRLPYGKHYTGITAAGLTRENTYVGNYGEEASQYLGEYFFKTWGHEGDEELNDEILKLTLRNLHARAHTRYPAADDSGINRLMRTEGVIDERNVYSPGIPGYCIRINRGQSLFLAAVEAHMAAHADRYAGSGWDMYWEYARQAVGISQQQLADRQYFNQFNAVTQWLKVDLRLAETWAYLTGGRATYDRFGTVKAKRVLPQTDFRSYSAAEIAELGVDPADYERFAWVDVDNMFVSMRDGDTRIFGSLYVQNRGVAGSGRLHVMAPAHEHTVQLRTNGRFQFRDYWARTGNIDADFMEDINTGDDWAPQAPAGKICPIAYQPGVGTISRENFEPDHPYSGYVDFLTARYGRYLFGINTTCEVHELVARRVRRLRVKRADGLRRLSPRHRTAARGPLGGSAVDASCGAARGGAHGARSPSECLTPCSAGTRTARPWTRVTDTAPAAAASCAAWRQHGPGFGPHHRSGTDARPAGVDHESAAAPACGLSASERRSSRRSICCRGESAAMAKNTPMSIVVTSSASTSARSVPSATPCSRMSAIVAVTRSREGGGMRLAANPARSVSIIPRLVATKVA